MATHDFADTIIEHLAERRVFRPATKFISELALCPRCIGGPEKGEFMKNLILQMVSLVRSKADANRNNRLHKAWLKEAAKAMELFQLESRDWISEHVFALPALPTPVEQVYDPNRGKKDIRYATSEEEVPMECQEEIDEEALLADSPTKPVTTSDSPVRRSPRILRSKKLQGPQVIHQSPGKNLLLS